MLRIVEDILIGTYFYDFAAVHDGDTVTQLGNNAQVMSNHDYS